MARLRAGSTTWVSVVCHYQRRCNTDIFTAGMTVSMLTQLGAVVLYTPTFILPAILIAIIGGWLGNIYLRAQLSVKREMSNAKAPVIGILSGAITGLSKPYHLL